MSGPDATREIDAAFAAYESSDDAREFARTLERLMDTYGADAVNRVHGHEEFIKDRLTTAERALASIMGRLMPIYLATSKPLAHSDYPDAPTSGPAGERLIAGLMLVEQAHQTIPFDEFAVTETLEPLAAIPDEQREADDVFARSVLLLRTASYYVLDANDSHAAIASEPPDQELFPPLPFPRVWIETHAGHNPVPLLAYDIDDRSTRAERLKILGVGIAEVERHKEWDVYVAFQEDDSKPTFWAYRLTPEVSSAPFLRGLWAIAVGAAHLISARNVGHHEIALPRAQRKRLARTTGLVLAPKLYRIDLAGSGEHGAAGTGREYHVRWLVRGHWRHVDSGMRWCTCCSPERPATWIEPYIKGPVGAPWKGRAVRVRPSSFAASRTET